MALTIYKSTDASAPVLNNTFGSLIAVLDACLVNGYGAKAAAGWSKAFTGSNAAAYQAPSGNRRYLQVDDSAAATTYFRMFETMSSATVGTNGTPGATVGITKPASTYQYWEVVATSSVVYVYVWSATSTVFDPLLKGVNSYGTILGFGDSTPFNAGDTYATFLFGGASSTATSTPNAVVVNHYMIRPFTQIGTYVQFGVTVPGNPNSVTVIGSNSNYLFSYPNAADGSVLYAPIWITEPAASVGCVRAVMPGIWAPLHNQVFNTGDEFTNGTKTFRCWNLSAGGQVLIEITDTWGT